jgi:hypothetical protein
MRKVPKYILMFDLASHITGWCVYDVHLGKPVERGIINVDRDQDCPDFVLMTDLSALIKNKIMQYSDIMVATEAMPTQLRGGSSTIKTFVAMARAHCDLDLACEMTRANVYDRIGVYPASTHAYIKRILGKDKDFKPTKDDIKTYVCSTYKIDPKSITYDETDAIFLAKTLIDVKWDKDIQERIKELKRHKKELKTDKGRLEVDLEIQEERKGSIHPLI